MQDGKITNYIYEQDGIGVAAKNCSNHLRMSRVVTEDRQINYITNRIRINKCQKNIKIKKEKTRIEKIRLLK